MTTEATLWLHGRGVRVMGIDAWRWDQPLPLQAAEARRRGEPEIFWAAHRAGIEYAQIEGLVNLAALPPTGFSVSCSRSRSSAVAPGRARVVPMIEDTG